LSKERVSESDDANEEHVSPVETGADKGDEAVTDKEADNVNDQE
jgi:hypothetical protein